MNRNEAIDILVQLLNDSYKEKKLTQKERDALDMAVISLKLWDNFVEKLSMRCNEAKNANTWNVFRKAIELIKSEFDEKIG